MSYHLVVAQLGQRTRFGSEGSKVRILFTRLCSSRSKSILGLQKRVRNAGDGVTWGKHNEYSTLASGRSADAHHS